MRRDALPKGFGQRPSSYSHLHLPDGVKSTFQLIVDRTFGRRSVCPLSIKQIAFILGKDRHTIGLHIAFLGDLGILRRERLRRGDGRSFRIVLCFRELGSDLGEVSSKVLTQLPEKALQERTLGDFKAECKSRKRCKSKAVA